MFVLLPVSKSLSLTLQRIAVIAMLHDELAHIGDAETEFAGEIADLILFVTRHPAAIPIICFTLVVWHDDSAPFRSPTTRNTQFCCRHADSGAVLAF
ncbi:hypothetical protein X731_31080 [Mesorhizobium sp. L2C054A000]|nr:hypothetical protein X731_31080 [Mesorhizobium sp. L2C054A000]